VNEIGQRRASGIRSREAFIATTGRLLRRQGYSGTGLSEIVAASGAPKGSLYFHFPGGKEELAAVAMARAGDELRGAIVAILSSHDALGDALCALLDALAAGLEASDYADGCPIATVALEAATRSESVRVVAADAFDSWVSALRERMLAGGMARETADRRALLVLAAVEGALILARARRDLVPLRAVREELLELAG